MRVWVVIQIKSWQDDSDVETNGIVRVETASSEVEAQKLADKLTVKGPEWDSGVYHCQIHPTYMED